jgi:hypothetical protein
VAYLLALRLMLAVERQLVRLAAMVLFHGVLAFE